MTKLHFHTFRANLTKALKLIYNFSPSNITLYFIRFTTSSSSEKEIKC